MNKTIRFSDSHKVHLRLNKTCFSTSLKIVKLVNMAPSVLKTLSLNFTSFVYPAKNKILILKRYNYSNML